MRENITNNELSILQQYQDIVDNTNIVSKTNTDGIITYVNSQFIDISGYSHEELIGKPHNIVRDPKVDPSVFEKLWKTIEAKNIWHGIVTNLKKDGTKYTVKASIFPILNDNNEIVEYISIRHEITELLELNNKLDEINNYKTQQELLAKSKLEAGIVNDLQEDEYTVLYQPSDILSGDFYSLYKMQNGAIFAYLIDGQGHGVSPALTVFAISSMLNQFVYQMPSMDQLIQKLYPDAKNFLGDCEQLSYIMLMIAPDKKSLTYASGGMYPFFVKTANKTIKVKANNTPFMNFSDTPTCQTIAIDNWESIMLYTDGIIEHENKEFVKNIPENILNNSLNINTVIQQISTYDFEDDITLINIYNK